MAGASDPPFRRAAQAAGCRYSVSEIVAAEPLAKSRRDVLRRAAGEALSPLIIQLAGREPAWLARGARIAEDLGADGIDINMGCPAKQVTSGACGSALMRDLDHAERLIAAVCAATPLPVTLKMRLGWDAASLNAADLARRAEQAGVCMVVVHGRTRSQFYTGKADWAAIQPVVQAVAVPVIANGDIRDVATARIALGASGAAGVMVGRAATGRPWLPGALAEALKQGTPLRRPTWAQECAALMVLVEDCLSFYGSKLGIRVVRKHLAGAIDARYEDPAAARQVRHFLCTQEDPKAVFTCLENFANGGSIAAAA